MGLSHNTCRFRLIINCKLHQIDYEVMQEMAPTRLPPLEGQSRWDSTLLGRPKNVEDLAMRIAIFWHVCHNALPLSLA